MTNNEIMEIGNKYVMGNYKRGSTAFVKGMGSKVWDADGKEYIDFLAGIAVNSLGYNNKKLVEAIKEQSEKIMHSSNLFWVEPQVKLAQLICENSFADKVFFCNSGAEANEAAIKLARKYSLNKYGSERYNIISMVNSFHGRTMGSLSATGQEKYHKNFLPMLPGFKFAEFNNYDSLLSLIDDSICAVILEPVQGEGGICPAELDYIKKVRELCTQKDIILIFDEVQCGVGRTGALFAYEKLSVAPDVMTLAKGLAGGVPIGALAANEKFGGVLVPGDHGSTFGGNHLACAAGCAVIEEIKENLLQNVNTMSSYILSKLDDINKELNCIESIKGMGLMLGVKITVDSGKVVEECLKKGLILNSLGNNMLRLVPPLVINSEEVDKAMDILKSVLALLV
ncbi:acetylornithine aminotransferase [Oxobacter pfennigii]|uniref:Acetylornithine aminotransferase n=1 Tax=Oxobacter pfennigii TaxID=36849 RepID=A0A0P8WDB3_9CLOT|nr:aspartate aminotransferase family protein [Oxobacter pfennigii]KPU45882.1 acetylornithine aminotransferase [Oxobacter pfennigii]